jgi:guanine deaminase
MLENGVDPVRPQLERGVPHSRIDVLAAFWMATVGGARVLGLPVGLIEVGYLFDAIAVDTSQSGGPLRAWIGLDTPERIFEKIVRLTSPAEIITVWVGGRKVVSQCAAGEAETVEGYKP